MNIGNSKTNNLQVVRNNKEEYNKQVKFKIKPRNNSVFNKVNSKNLFSEIKYKPDTSIEKGNIDYL